MVSSMDEAGLVVGVDVGGTFTDVVSVDRAGMFEVMKLPTTRSAPQKAVAQALEQLTKSGVTPDAIEKFAHGTTVATNAVLERKGGPIGLLLTEGFRDILEIGRSYRPDMYAMFLKRTTPDFLAHGTCVQTVRERITSGGRVVTEIDEASLRSAIAALVDAGVNAIAVSFIFSFDNPAHELAAKAMIAEMAPGMPVSLSHEVDPMFREYERTSITAFDAYVKPLLVTYLGEMSEDLRRARVTPPLQVMQSRGGLTAANVASSRPVRLFLSGPAGGVIGAKAAGEIVGARNLISFDVGGTSCDIALIQDGEPIVKSTGSIGGYTVRVPMVDVNAIGAGGGSIAWIDAGGGLRVGPHSAGSEPGPAAYGRGGEDATVTDASIVLGYLDPGYFAGGTMTLDPDLAFRAVEEKVARPLGLSIEDAALGIHRVLNAQMAEGIRLVSVQRGLDPRDFALVPLGGGGGIHAVPLARDLSMPRIIVPRLPGVLAACGLLAAPVEHELFAAFNRDLSAVRDADILAAFDALEAKAAALMEAEGFAGRYDVRYALDMCYVGQAHFVEVPVARAEIDGVLEPIAARFRSLHETIHGHGEGGETRVVNVRIVASAASSVASATPQHIPTDAPLSRGTRAARFETVGAPVAATLYDRAALPEGTTIDGPAIVEQSDTTTLVEPGWSATVAAGGTLILTRT